MTSKQQLGQANEAAQFNAVRTYPCPDCGGVTHFMGIDFKAPKKTDFRAWQQVQEFINSGRTFYRGSQDLEDSKA